MLVAPDCTAVTFSGALDGSKGGETRKHFRDGKLFSVKIVRKTLIELGNLFSRQRLVSLVTASFVLSVEITTSIESPG